MNRDAPPSVDEILDDRTRFFCIGLNYADHVSETGRSRVSHPTVFVRYASSMVGSGDDIVVPAASDHLDFEGELAAVIGRPGRAIDPVDALDHVTGYACFLDGSVRDFQNHTSQFTPGKNFDATGSIGPLVVPAADVGDPSEGWRITTTVSGDVLQDSATDHMIFPVPELIAYLSTFTALRRGDVIATGTPSGVGVARSPQRFLRPGDTVEIEIAGIGTLTNRVVAEP